MTVEELQAKAAAREELAGECVHHIDPTAWVSGGPSLVDLTPGAICSEVCRYCGERRASK